MKSIINIIDKLENLLASLAGIVILFLMLSTILEVTARFFFNTSFVWIQEYNEYALLYIPFLAGAWLLRLNGHVVVDLIDNFVSPKISKVLEKIVVLIGVATMAIMLYASIIVTINAFRDNLTSVTILHTPQAYVYIIIPIGTLFMLIEFIRQFTQRDIERHDDIEELT